MNIACIRRSIGFVCVILVSVSVSSIAFSQGVIPPSSLSREEILIALATLNPSDSAKGLFRLRPQQDRALEVAFRKQVIESEVDAIRKLHQVYEKLEMESLNRIEELESHTAQILKQSEKDAILPLVDRETTELMIRNCALELQKILWDEESEKALASEQVKSTGRKFALLQLEAAKEQLSTSQKILEELKGQWMRAQKLSEQGSASSSQVSDLRLRFLEEERRLATAKLAVEDATSRIESDGENSTVSAALRVKARLLRRQAIEKQIGTLVEQRKAIERVESLRAKQEALKKSMEEVRHRRSESAIVREEKQILVDAINRGLAEFETRRKAMEALKTEESAK